MEMIPPVIHESWYPFLQPLFEDEKMKLIKNRVLAEQEYYPSTEDIFRVFSMSMDQIRVVVLGQDPYPNGEAIGLAFAVDSKTKTPYSLRVIQEEVLRKEGIGNTNPLDKELKHWVDQGVFLLNTALTVEVKNPNSHSGYWQWFTRAVVEIISRECNPIWMLWGSKAQQFKDEIIRGNSNAAILTAPHPAASAYSSGKVTFIGSNNFNQANEILAKRNQQIINW